MKSTYGDRLLPELSRALTAEFGKGFAYANLRNFRQFYLTYPDPEICYTLRSKLSWTHHRLIMPPESQTALCLTPNHGYHTFLRARGIRGNIMINMTN